MEQEVKTLIQLVESTMLLYSKYVQKNKSGWDANEYEIATETLGMLFLFKQQLESFLNKQNYINIEDMDFLKNYAPMIEITCAKIKTRLLDFA